MILIIFSNYYFFNLPENLIHKIKLLLDKNCILYFGLPYKSVISELSVTKIYICNKTDIHAVALENITFYPEENTNALHLNIEKLTDVFHHSIFKENITNKHEPILFYKKQEKIQIFDFTNVKDHPKKVKNTFVFDENSVEDIPLLNIFNSNS